MFVPLCGLRYQTTEVLSTNGLLVLVDRPGSLFLTPFSTILINLLFSNLVLLAPDSYLLPDCATHKNSQVESQASRRVVWQADYSLDAISLVMGF